MTRRIEMQSRIYEAMPFIVMLVVTLLDISLLVVVKAAMNGGMKSIVYVVYHDSLATLILFPFFVIHVFRNPGRPRLTFHIIVKFFILGLLGICLYEVLAYLGIDYSSPTMATAIGNLQPGITFLLAVAFRIEKIDIRSSSSGAKLLGTIIAIAGAMVFTFYQGPKIFQTISTSSDLPNQILLSVAPNWAYGGLLLFISVICGCLWNVMQTTLVREFPDQQTIVFFMCLFGSIQCIALAPFVERNPGAWVVQPGIGMIAVVFGALHSSVLRCIVVIWCLEKKGPVFVAMFSPLSIVFSIMMGIAFLGDTLLLGSIIGATVVTVGFYTVMWGHSKEKNTLQVEFPVADEVGSSNQTTPLLSSRNNSK